MNRRLRKKLRKGEFVECGFDLRATLRPSDDPTDIVFWDAMIDAIEARGLECGGGGRRGEVSLFVTAANRRCCGLPRRARRSATDADREALVAWLRARPEVLEAAAGPLVDAWWPR